MARDVNNEVGLLARLLAENIPQSLGLDVVLRGDLIQVRDGCTGPLLMVVGDLDGPVGQGAVGGWVVGVGTVVAVDGHCTIAVGWVECSDRSVDGDLLVVDTEAVAVGIWV